MATRTATPAAEVSALIAENVKYVGKAPTPNLAAFAAFVRSSDAVPTKMTKAESAAFDLGITLAGLRARFTSDRSNGRIDRAESFEDYAIRTTGVEPKSDAERTALVAGIRCYVLYRKYQDSKKVAASA